MIRRDHINLTFQIKFESAFHCGSGRPDGLTDRSVKKDRKGYLFIPGSTIKGVLRENSEHIARIYGLPVRDPHDAQEAVNVFIEGPDIVERIFGSRYREGNLFFDNAWMLDKDFFDSESGDPGDRKYIFMQTENRTQTSLSRRTGTVKEGCLYTSEFGISELVFEGQIHGCLSGLENDLSELPGSYPLFLLIAGIYKTERIGADRSVGMGRCRFLIKRFAVNDKEPNPEKYCEELESLMCYEDAKEEQ